MEMGWQLFALALIFTVSSVSAAGGICVVCDSSKDDCQKTPESIVASSSCTSESCFTLLDSTGNIKRGCVDDTNKCDTKNCMKCTPTADKPCNIQTFWCNTCDSSTDPNCAYWKNEKDIQIGFCNVGVTKCLMRIVDDTKNTQRRCLEKNDEVCGNTKKCEICENANCNKGIFPSDRRICYQCDSADSKCATPTKFPNDIVSSPCLLYDEADKCFEHGTSEVDMSRGCVSDKNAYTKCSSLTPKEKCHECTADGCNVDEFKVDPNIKCITCKSDDPKCAWGYKPSDATKCQTKIEYWKTQACYTNKIDASKVERGCIQDLTIDCAGVASCTSCASGDACNNADGNDFSCYKCRSDENPKCASKLVDAESYKAEKCRNPVSETEAKCYTELYDGIVIRSCLVDCDSKTQKNCLDEKSTTCKSCTGVNCNKDDPPSSAHGLILTSGLLTAALLFLKFF